MEDKQAYRLLKLMEECAEVIQCASKCLEHGMDDYHPKMDPLKDNRDRLTRELGHVEYWVNSMIRERDIDGEIRLRYEFDKQNELEPRKSITPFEIPPGTPCDHPGCLNHVTHPCEGCGRIQGRK